MCWYAQQFAFSILECWLLTLFFNLQGPEAKRAKFASFVQDMPVDVYSGAGMGAHSMGTPWQLAVHQQSPTYRNLISFNAESQPRNTRSVLASTMEAKIPPRG